MGYRELMCLVVLELCASKSACICMILRFLMMICFINISLSLTLVFIIIIIIIIVAQVIEDPNCYTYIRPEGKGMMVGLFEARVWVQR